MIVQRGAPLPSTRQTTRTERLIRSAVTQLGYRGALVYEHGHWWLLLRDGTVFDVVDASGPGSINGFALERV